MALVILQALTLGPAQAATPTAKPKANVASIKSPLKVATAKPKPKSATVKSTPHSTTTKPSSVFATTTPAKKSPISKKLAAAKKKAALAKKKAALSKAKPVHHYYYRPSAPKPVPPSPSPAWPPHGFTSVGSAYARIPTGTELVGILSAMKDAASPVSSCSIDPTKPNTPAYSCAAVLVGATERCTWWKVSADISGIDPVDATARVDLGQISVLEPGAPGKTIQTIVLVSPVPLQTGVRFSGIHAMCGIGPSADPVPSNTFIAAPAGTPAPGEPTPSATPAPSNS
jgi:hypothetical protein